ncbi:MAG: hypothetical protein R2798_10110 [Chitinophagales bacterium]|nr:hypothetical protein [Bacteroidota bacterium]MCB9044082.1 hypothetical protein [Chitinophagales bacterium]
MIKLNQIIEVHERLEKTSMETIVNINNIRNNIQRGDGTDITFLNEPKMTVVETKAEISRLINLVRT